ncbi:MAG: hypothetical protein FJ276_00370 [Planctomycetes bacterium]|nr:hypothetical protein [Planctomycetota bacterium]
MFPRLGRNLTLVYCLVLQAFAWPCFACPCLKSATQVPPKALSERVPDQSRTECQLCRGSSNALVFQRASLPNQYPQLLAAGTFDVFLPDGGVFARTACRVAKTTLPSRDLSELQVFLE